MLAAMTRLARQPEVYNPTVITISATQSVVTFGHGMDQLDVYLVTGGSTDETTWEYVGSGTSDPTVQAAADQARACAMGG